MADAPWSILGIEPTSDRSAVRRAYAARLKHTNPEDDPAGFMALRAAFEAALHQSDRMRVVDWYAQQQDRVEDPAPPPSAAMSRTTIEAPAAIESTAPDVTLDAVSNTRAAGPEELQGSAGPEVAAPGPEDDRQRISEALAKLQRQLWGPVEPELDQAAAAVSPWDTAQATLENILADPAMDRVEIHLLVEGALSEIVEVSWQEHPELARRAVEFFGWDNRIWHRLTPNLSGFLEEEEEHPVLWRVGQTTHEYHAVYLFLRQIPDPGNPLWMLRTIWFGLAITRFFADASDGGRVLQARLPAHIRTYWLDGGLRSIRFARFLPLAIGLGLIVLRVLWA